MTQRPMKTHLLCLASLLASSIAVSACNSPSSPSPGATSSGAAASTATATATAKTTATAGNTAAPDDSAYIGKPAPDFTATAYDGKPVHLAALKGKPVVIYFYPKDETPGCTAEACSFRDAWADLAKTNVTLIGVSMDNAESHKEFVDHWKLPFVLITDADGSIAKSFGVPVKNIISRQTIVIGADGNVKKIYRSVDVQTHAAQILADLKS